MALLTDQSLASGVTLNDLIHIVIPTDTSQNPAGSSFKATIKQVADSITGSTVNLLGKYLPLSGGTVTGNTYFGITSGITLDQVNSRIGVGTTNPITPLDIRQGQAILRFSGGTGGSLEISGSTDLPRLSAIIPPYLTKPFAAVSMGIRSWDDSTRNGYGKVGDAHLYASNEANGLNIINRQGTGTEDYIRFYAGQDADGTIPDIHIVGTGSTRGYVGIGTINPTANLDINGKTKVINLQMTSGATANYIMVSDASGNGFWTGLTASQIPTRYYGVFTSNVTQTNPVANVARAMSADTTEHNNGVILSANTRFVVQNGGTYNIQFSAQLQQLNNSDSAISIWFRKNGVNIDRSNTEMSIDKNQGGASKLVAAWNIIETFTANQYIEIMWSSPDTGMEILWQNTQTGPTRPSTPSIIVTVTQV
jgi:hypothetical protein